MLLIVLTNDFPQTFSRKSLQNRVENQQEELREQILNSMAGENCL